MRELPSRFSSKPAPFKKAMRSSISGSRAGFTKIVSPSAPQAAMRRFSVAPTLGYSRAISVPFGRPRQRMRPDASSTRTPMALSPFRCRSTGRLPMSQPPG